MSARGADLDCLYGRLALAAVALDDLRVELGAADLDYDEAEAMFPVMAHLELVVDGMRDALYRAQELDQRPRRHNRIIDQALRDARRGASKGRQTMSTRACEPMHAPNLPPAGPERERMFWRMSGSERVALMRAGELSIAECCRWASRAPREVPLVDGEFEFIAAFSPEARER